eukprot:4172053-Pleurochrysis_carterae.AAC.1
MGACMLGWSAQSRACVRVCVSVIAPRPPMRVRATAPRVCVRRQGRCVTRESQGLRLRLEFGLRIRLEFG